MKLSEAIKEGARQTGQGFGRWQDRADPKTACAVEAAMLAFTGEITTMGFKAECAKQGIPPFPHRPCPDCGHHYFGMEVMMIHLNDVHRWTRERIADWVEQFESPAPPPEGEQTCSKRV